MTRRRKAAAIAATALALGLVAQYEGRSLTAYRDLAGIPTICFGQTTGVQMGDQATPEMCDSSLAADLRAAIGHVERRYPAAPRSVLAAFGSAVYNLGPGKILDPEWSQAARYLGAGDWRAACDQLPRWNTVKGRVYRGLTRRREEERRLCLLDLGGAL